MRQQALRFAGERDPSVIVDPKSWLADKLWTLLDDVGSNYYVNIWGNEYLNGGVRFPHRHLYLHGTCKMWALGDKLTRYHQFVQMVGDAYLMPPAHEHVLAGETIALQCQSIV